MENNENSKKSERDQNGRFLPGNTIGQLPKNKLWGIKELEQSILRIEAKRVKEGKDPAELLDYFLERAFENDRVLVELVGKNIPKKTLTELKGDGGAWNVFITEFNSDSDLPQDLKKKIEDYRKKQLIKQGERENQS